MKKRIFSFALALALVFALVPAAGTPQAAGMPQAVGMPQAAAAVLPGTFVLIPPTLEYNWCGEFSEGLAYVAKNDQYGNTQYGFIDKTGKLVIPLEYDVAYDFKEGLAQVCKSVSGSGSPYKYGFIDKTGKVVVPLEYDVAYDFKEGLAHVYKNDKCGFIDKTGKVVIPLEYDWADGFSEGLAQVGKRVSGSGYPYQYGFVDKTGKVVVPLEYNDTHDFSEGLALVYKNSMYGFVNKTGKVIVPLIYDDAEDFHDGVAPVHENGQWRFINKSGGFVASLGAYDWVYWEGEENGQWIAETINGMFLLDKTGKDLVGPGSYDYIWWLGYEDFFCVKDSSGNVGVIDRIGKVVVPPGTYDYFGEWGDGALLYVEDFSWNVGIVNRAGQEIIPPGTYGRIDYGGDGLVWFWEAGKWGLLKLEGYGDIVVPSTTPDDAVIDLNAETITLPGFTVAAYSINGGKSWKKGALPTEQAKFSKLFNKELTLWVADTVDKKGKPTSDANIIKFPKINARPKANPEKLKPYFDAETWTLKTKTGGEAAKTYEWAPTIDKKTPSGDWRIVSAAGFPVLSGKAKTTYLLRTPATESGGTYTPAGKIFKVTPANFGKAPNYAVKTDRKTSEKTIKLKANDWYQLGGDAPVKLTAKETLDVTGKAGTLTVWKGETGKKPRSEVQVVTLA